MTLLKSFVVSTHMSTHSRATCQREKTIEFSEPKKVEILVLLHELFVEMAISRNLQTFHTSHWGDSTCTEGDPG